VPESIIRRRFTAGLRNFFTLYRSVSDSWQIFDNSELMGPRLIASGRGASHAKIVDEKGWHRLVDMQQ